MTLTRLAPGNAPLYAAMAVLLGLSLTVQVLRDRGWQPYEPPGGVMWVRSGALAQRLALGYDNLAADIYWIRAVVYYGGQRLDKAARDFDQLYPLLDLVTSLDPHFRVAYRFGAIFLAEAFPGGAGRTDLAIALLEKGLARDPARWEYLQDIGFVHYWWLRDFASAAESYRRASLIPGAPSWLGPLAATTLAEGGSRESSRMLWTQLRDQTDIVWIQRTADHRLRQLDAMDVIDALNRITAAFAARHGRPPAGWPELAREQRWRGIPTDPDGEPFDLDPATGRVTLGRASTLHPLPDGASAMAAPR